MKILLAILALVAGSQAASSILTYKNTYKCETANKVSGSELLVDVQEAQDGQSQLIMTMSVKEKPLKVQTKKTVPPPMMAGGSTVYETRDSKAADQIKLSIGIRPVKVRNLVGKTSKLTVKGLFDDLAMVCFPATK